MRHLAVVNCPFGVAGDMLLGSLIDCGADVEFINHHLGSLGGLGICVGTSRVTRQTIVATKVDINQSSLGVRLTKDIQNRSFNQIVALIESSSCSDLTKSRAKEIFECLAQVEAQIHAIEIDQVHFHEVGAIDSIGDIVGTCLAMESLDLEHLEVGPVSLGRGTVDSSHGTLPNPAPATLAILRGLEVRFLDLDQELTTPTGAALVRCLGTPLRPHGKFEVVTSGYGAGSRELDAGANLVQTTLVVERDDPSSHLGFARHDQLAVIETNLDDVSGELIGYTLEKLIAEGARDCWVTNYTGKKGRPGVVISVLANPLDVSRLSRLLVEETGSLGLRTWQVERFSLERSSRVVQIDGCDISVKYSELGAKPEYDDLVLAAQKLGRPLRTLATQALIEFFGQDST